MKSIDAENLRLSGFCLKDIDNKEKLGCLQLKFHPIYKAAFWLGPSLSFNPSSMQHFLKLTRL